MSEDTRIGTASGFIREMQRRFKERAALDDDQALYHAMICMENTEDDLGAFGSEAGARTRSGSFARPKAILIAAAPRARSAGTPIAP